MAITYLSGGRIQGSSTSGGSFTPAGSFNVRYIVVGGGSGAGTNNGGGGGSGAFRTNASYGVTAQTYDIAVGAKSIGQTDTVSSNTPLANGGDSSFGSITSNGGGTGAQGGEVGGNSVNGSGGGGGHATGNGTGGGTYGFNGGDGGGSPAHGGGGGGGSSAIGGDAGSNGGTGGAGTNSDITGSTVNYAAGGGGGAQAGSVGQGGNNDAGDGGNNAVGGNATTTTTTSSAGNGGGGGQNGPNKGGDGSDGIVIIRFTTSGNSYSKVGGVVSTVGSDTLITYLVGNSVIDDKATFLGVGSSSSYGTVSFAGGISGNPDTRNLQLPTNPLQAVTVGSGGASTTAFTISFWMKSDNGIDSNDAFMGTMDGASSNGDHFQIRISDSDGLEIMDGSTYAKWEGDYTRASINDNVWHHIALTRPASSSVVTAYLDGVDKGDETYTGRFTSNISNTVWLAINGRGDNTGVAGVMSIQDLGFWIRELSGADIAVLATGKPINRASLATTYTTGLTSYYDFDGDYVQAGGSNGTNTGIAGAGVSRATSGGKFDTYVPSTSDLPTGTRFEETDTRKIFRIKAGDWAEKGAA